MGIVKSRYGIGRSVRLGAVDGVLLVLFGCFWCWNWIVFESPTDLPVSLGISGLVLPSRTISLASFAVVGIGGFLLLRGGVGLPSSRWGRAARYGMLVLFVVVVGVLDGADGLLDGKFGDEFAFVVGGCTGAIGAALYLDWGRFFGMSGIGNFRFAVVACVVSSLVAALLGACMFWLGDQARQWFVLAFPLVSLPLLKVLGAKSGRVRAVRRGGDATSNRSYVPVKFIVSLTLLGLALGLMQSIFTQSNTIDMLSPLSTAGFAVAALASVGAIYVLKLDFNRLMYQIGFPMIALGFLVMVLLGNAFAGYILSIAGYRFTELVVWILGIYLTTRIPHSQNWVFLLIGGLLSFGQAAGLAFMDGRFEEHLTEVSIVAVAVLLLGSLFLITSKDARESWGIVSPGTADNRACFDEACAIVVRRSMLTARESDVFALLAQGRNKRLISSKLVLSENTVKTHISSVYQKLGIHSQQELIDMVEEQLRDVQKRSEGLDDVL